MRTPSPIWETTYRHDRRKHRHRCRCCAVIINTDEPVIMARVTGGRSGTWAIHKACGDTLFSTPVGSSDSNGWTWRDAMICWGTENLLKRGFKIEQHPMARAGTRKEAA